MSKLIAMELERDGLLPVRPEVHNLMLEGLISCAKASRCVPALDGRPPHPSTIFRWMKDGVNGKRLEYVKVGRKIATSEAALARFFEAVAAADPAPRSTPTTSTSTSTTKVRTATQRQRDIAAAEQVCAKLGV